LDLYLATKIPNFTLFSGAKECLKNLSKFCCRSDIYSEFFVELSKSCHNIQSLSIRFLTIISNGLADLISAQRNLKYLYITLYYSNSENIFTILTKLPNTLIKLYLNGKGRHYLTSLSFVTKFTHIQEIILSFDNRRNSFGDFKELQNAVFSHLQVLKFEYASPKYGSLIKFLENNGRNLKEFYIGYGTNNSLNLAIAKFCQNLRKLFARFKKDELETLKLIFNSCQYLESIQIWCC
jgi:hypothetical protein